MKDGSVGLVCPSPGDYWLGGLHYIEHLLASVSSLPPEERISFRDVWWNEAPATDPFAEIRHMLDGQAVVSLPRAPWPRLKRWLRRRARGLTGQAMADIFEDAGVRAVFPFLPVDAPGVPLIFWLTDLQYCRHPEYYPEERRRWFEAFNRRNGAAAARVVVMSDAVLADARHFLPEVAEKASVVRVCSVPTPTWWRADPAKVVERYGLPGSFFVISNQVCVHKNHQTVFDAVKLLRDRGTRINVVCTGRTEDYRDPRFFPTLLGRVTRDGLESQVRFVGAVPREDHVALLRRSLALVQPSLFEGWGLAISDAKALGKPVLASDLPVHHEHGHPRITYVAPAHVDAWADALLQANADLAPGPDRLAEEEAASLTREEAQRVGRSVVALFSEVMD